MSNFKPVTNFWFWCQKVLPLVYDDSISYYEVLCKMSEYLNQVINNVNALPDIIDEAVKEYIESGEIQKVLNEMLQNFNPINVKNPPAKLTTAKGDGETDDTAALQAMIEYGAEYNLPMIFPAGVYRVTSLNIPESAYFWGVGDPTIFKTPNSENALIAVTGDFTAFNMRFNGNIAGNIVPADIITGTAENISLSQCNFTGCVSCVDVSAAGILDVAKCHFSNYTDYAIHANGAGRLMIDGMEVDNVANSGAMRFVKIDTDNSIVKNLTSLAKVPIGVEITGDFNSVEARIPNCENPVSDGGQNNSYTAIGQVEKRSLQNLTENIAENSEENVGSEKNITAENIRLNPTQPLNYNKTPVNVNQAFSYVPFKNDNSAYQVLTRNGSNALPSVLFANVKDYGAKGDGTSDDTAAFNSAIENNDFIFIPNGTYNITTLTLPDNVTLLGESLLAVLKQVGATSDFIVAGNNCKFINLTIDCNGAGKTGEYAGIRFIQKTKGLISGCEIINGIQWCVYSNGSTDIRVEHSEFYGCTNGAAITLAGNNDGYCVIDDIYSHNNDLDGIVVGQPHTTVINSFFTENGTEETGACGIFCNDNADYAYIANNTCLANHGIGIEVAGSSDQIKIIGNNVISNQQDGIEIRQVKNVVVTNNYVYDNLSPTFNAQISYSVTAGNINSIIDGNVVDCNGKTQYGIYAPDANRCYGHNICSNFETAALNVSQSAEISAVAEPHYEFLSRKYVRFTDTRWLQIINAGSNQFTDIAFNKQPRIIDTGGNLLRVECLYAIPETAPATPQSGDFYEDSTGLHIYRANQWKTISYD